MRLSGGVTGSEVWSQILADVLGTPLTLMDGADASAVGAAMIGHLALTTADLETLTKGLPKGDTLLPDSSRHAEYERETTSYRALYETLHGGNGQNRRTERDTVNTLLLGFEEDTLTEEQIARVESATSLRVLRSRDQNEIESVLDSTEVAAGSFPRDLLAKAPALRWFQQWGAGADWLLRYPDARAADFTLTNVSGIHAVPISEHILAFLLTFARGFPQAHRAQARREWLKEGDVPVFELAGKEVLLVGVGEIGARTARLAAALGMRVVGVRRDPSKGVEGVTRMVSLDGLLEELPDADAVVLTTPLTEETRGMIGTRELGAMKETSLLVNIGRGELVDERALIDALQEGSIAGAGLDVFEEEPLPQDSPLWEMENVILTSHYSGSTPHYHERALEIFLDNLTRYGRGEPLHHVVDKARGY